MVKHQISRFLYKNFVKPVLFQFDAEFVHNRITDLGESLESYPHVLESLYSCQNPSLKKTVLGVEFPNPVGLAAGFDYDGHLAKVIPAIGFGFSTVGTVTARPYSGNPTPRLARLPKSQSLLVNKGFKSEGAKEVAKRLNQKNFTNEVVSISVGSSNIPEINTLSKAINDYLETFSLFKNKKYVKFFELNISCPNTAMTESFTSPKNFLQLVKAVNNLKIAQPIFVKMPNEIDTDDSDKLVNLALNADIRGFIFSNLVKNRSNPALDNGEIDKIKNLKGNFSGRPTSENAKNLLIHTRRKFGKNIALISTGGIFTPEDALERIQLGADLIQLITGMIYEGPQLAGEINESIAAAVPLSRPRTFS